MTCKQVSAEVEPAKYTALFQQMQGLVVIDVADVGLLARDNVAHQQALVRGYQPSP